MLLGIGAGLYASFGSANLADQPLAERMLKRHQEVATTEDIAALVLLLQRKTEEDPGNVEQWMLLARSFAFLERYNEAADAYRRAGAAGGDRPDILSAYAEAVTLANENRVTNEARLVFEQVLAVMPEDTRARYYLGLADAQAQNYRQAMDRWLALLNDSPQGTPWVPQVRGHVLDMAAFLGIDAKTVLPDVTPEELTATAGATPEGAEETIEALKTRLESEPKDYQAWLALARLQVKAGDVDGARASLERVSELYDAAPFVQQEIRQAAAALGLDAASESGTAAQPGPTESDVAAAADMTEGERAAMIKGMVAGLAARLDQEPDDLEGWVILIRSYSILGDRDAASRAFARARDHFTGNQDAIHRLDESAAEVGVQATGQ
ncbi:MAG: TPR domain-containing protein [Methyloceanibacter sp.]